MSSRRLGRHALAVCALALLASADIAAAQPATLDGTNARVRFGPVSNPQPHRPFVAATVTPGVVELSPGEQALMVPPGPNPRFDVDFEAASLHVEYTGPAGYGAGATPPPPSAWWGFDDLHPDCGGGTTGWITGIAVSESMPAGVFDRVEFGDHHVEIFLSNAYWVVNGGERIDIQLDFACPVRRGLTWEKTRHHVSTGTDKVGCRGCDPYVGDTLCSEARPILCLKVSGAPNPGLNLDYYNGWAGGHIGLTAPVAGTALNDLATADALCVDRFGPGYRMAEHHDGGGGWSWSAYGNVDDRSRFWVHIDDRAGNCWD